MVETVDRVSDDVSSFMSPAPIFTKRDDGTLVMQITFGVPDTDTGRAWNVTITFDAWVTFLESIRTYGIDHAYELATVPFAMLEHNVTEEEARRIRETLLTIERYAPLIAEKREQLLLFSYSRLKFTSMRRERVAQIVSTLLGKKVESEAWRKAVDKWAHDKGLEKVDRRGRPRQKKQEK